ncbi:MAG: DNA polymerase III [Spirochaetaceae bacterium]|jgi:DNA polymerase-3 subunit gamma/tau|nr:DNA polymerase III [Spirochaetaceae bacterium]
MFENILGQDITEQLIRDIEGSTLAPSLLFAGPEASGKGSSALELGRVLCCEAGGSWNCPCASCASHRYLGSQDMLVLGPRPFSAEIAACRHSLSTDYAGQAPRLLFIRSIRKLLLRFSPVLWEGDAKLKKVNGLLLDINESLEDFSRAAEEGNEGELPALADAVLNLAFELEADGIGGHIPIDQIRRAAWWGRLAPGGKRKILIIENADRMQEGARNSLLKILEEPPPALTIVLCAIREGDLLPTLRSRLRVYRFIRREKACEEEVLRRVFRDKDGVLPGTLMDYLNAFIPPSEEELLPLAAWFAASVAAGAFAARRSQAGLSQALLALGKYASPLAEEGGLGRPSDMETVIDELIKRCGRFRVRGLFGRFLSRLLSLISSALRDEGPEGLVFRDYALERISDAGSAHMVYNQSPSLALERLFVELKEGLCTGPALLSASLGRTGG